MFVSIICVFVLSCLQIRLIFRGQPMVDDKSLADQGVQAGAVIHMIAALRGGC